MTDLFSSSAHPLIPPTQEADRLAWLRLLRSRRVGISTFYKLMSEHGSAQECLHHLPEIARAAGIDDYTVCPHDVAEAELQLAQKYNAQLICRGAPNYPTLLNDLSDAPPLFWARGDLALFNRPSLSIVGARNASSLGMRTARFLATELGEQGYVITSGLARGIDTAAHGASLGTGTIAVLGGGLDVPYPTENTQLMRSIWEQGVLISEQPFGTQPKARHFPIRNRIISGLSRAIIVIEAAAKSGSLITARNALDQGRDVFAVPGHPFGARASGCNMMIRDGATLIRNAADVIESLAPLSDTPPKPEPAQPEPKRSLRDTAKLHATLLNQLSPTPVSEDQVIRDLGISAAQAGSLFVDMEIEGHIQRMPGGLIALNAKH